MKSILSLFTCCIFTWSANAQVNNTSYVNKSKNKVLQLSIILPMELPAAWEYFTVDSNLVKWIAPVAHIELKPGGYIVTNYDRSKTTDDSSSIKLPILSYLDNKLIIFKVNLNSHFSVKLQQEDQYLQELIEFVPVGNGNTKIISSMLGWGRGKDWDDAYDFFLKGNEWTYNELLKAAR